MHNGGDSRRAGAMRVLFVVLMSVLACSLCCGRWLGCCLADFVGMLVPGAWLVTATYVIGDRYLT
jgi:hypothetical protein